MLLILADITAAMLFLSGASSPEDLSETEIERFEQLSRHRLHLNSAGRSRLIACGLFSAYQIASLEDYRSRYGDILSFTELSAVDGFGEEYAEALSYFVSLENLGQGRALARPIRQNLLLRASGRRKNTDQAGASGIKYSFSAGDRLDIHFSRRSSYTDDAGMPTLSASLSGKSGWRLLAGDFNARFGQALAFWSGFSMSGFSSADAFRKNGSGLSSTSSFSPSLRGLGFDFQAGRYSFCAAVDLPASRDGPEGCVLPVASAGYLSRNYSLGVQAWSLFSENPAMLPASAASIDWRIGAGYFNIFGELAGSIKAGDGPVEDWAMLAGVMWSPAYKTRFSLLLRHYGKDYAGQYAGAVRSSSKVRDEDGLSFGARYKWISATADYARHPQKRSSRAKLLLNLCPEFWVGKDVENPLSLEPSLRCIIKESNGVRRKELRSDLAMHWQGLHAGYRFHTVACKETSWLQYFETGYKNAGDPSREQTVSPSLMLRATIFCIDNWQDNIYCYERDIPGAFSSPAYYGRGYALSLLGSLRFRYTAGRKHLRHSLHLRGSLLSADRLSAPLIQKEVKIQYQLDL